MVVVPLASMKARSRFAAGAATERSGGPAGIGALSSISESVCVHVKAAVLPPEYFPGTENIGPFSHG